MGYIISDVSKKTKKSSQPKPKYKNRLIDQSNRFWLLFYINIRLGLQNTKIMISIKQPKKKTKICFHTCIYTYMTLLELFNLIKSEHIGYKFSGYNFFFY